MGATGRGACGGGICCGGGGAARGAGDGAGDGTVGGGVRGCTGAGMTGVGLAGCGAGVGAAGGIHGGDEAREGGACRGVDIDGGDGGWSSVTPVGGRACVAGGATGGRACAVGARAPSIRAVPGTAYLRAASSPRSCGVGRATLDGSMPSARGGGLCTTGRATKAWAASCSAGGAKTWVWRSRSCASGPWTRCADTRGAKTARRSENTNRSGGTDPMPTAARLRQIHVGAMGAQPTNPKSSVSPVRQSTHAPE
jgi:hypothetical protein